MTPIVDTSGITTIKGSNGTDTIIIPAGIPHFSDAPSRHPFVRKILSPAGIGLLLLLLLLGAGLIFPKFEGLIKQPQHLKLNQLLLNLHR